MDERQRILNRLEAGADSGACSSFLVQCDTLHRFEVYNHLVYERLGRKLDDLHKRYKACFDNWGETYYTMLMRFMGAPNNSIAFEQLAVRAEYKFIRRHIKSVKQLEALLLGASGLLDAYREDIYTLDLKREYEYMAHKYGIQKMKPGMWQTTKIYPHNHPIIRLSQLAGFMSRTELSLDGIMGCRTTADVEKFFAVEASEYWNDHFIPRQQSPKLVKRLGVSKAHILAINVVIPLQYAYACYTSNERLRTSAMSLLEDVPPENNVKVRLWTSGGVQLKNAFESQALIQLTDAYCRERRCSECPIGMRILYKAGV